MAIGFQNIITRTKKGKVTKVTYANHAISITFEKRFNSWVVGTDHYAPSQIAQLFRKVEEKLLDNYINAKIVHDRHGRRLEHEGKK